MELQMVVTSDFGDYVTHVMQKLRKFLVPSHGDHEGLSCSARRFQAIKLRRLLTPHHLKNECATVGLAGKQKNGQVSFFCQKAILVCV